MMAFYIWGNTPTVMGIIGIFTVLGGSLLYTLVKMGENKAVVSQPKPDPSSNGGDEEETVQLMPTTKPTQQV